MFVRKARSIGRENIGKDGEPIQAKKSSSCTYRLCLVFKTFLKTHDHTSAVMESLQYILIHPGVFTVTFHVFRTSQQSIITPAVCWNVSMSTQQPAVTQLLMKLGVHAAIHKRKKKHWGYKLIDEGTYPSTGVLPARSSLKCPGNVLQKCYSFKHFNQNLSNLQTWWHQHDIQVFSRISSTCMNPCPFKKLQVD